MTNPVVILPLGRKMSEEIDDFRMGTMFDHEHTMKWLKLAANKGISPQEYLNEVLDVRWRLLGAKE